MSNPIENLMVTEIARKRRSGYTTAICKLAKELDATVLVYDARYAKLVNRDHGVKAKSVHANLRGETGPFVWDSTAFIAASHAVNDQLSKKDNKILKLNSRISKLEAELAEQTKLKDYYIGRLRHLMENPLMRAIAKFLNV